jgi:hypothetical protein
MKALRCMAAAMAARHAWPVWGAEDDNTASHQLAAKLGFVPSGRLALFRRSGGG